MFTGAILRSRQDIPAGEFGAMERRFLGIEPFIAAECPCCQRKDVDTRQMRMCHRLGS